MSVGCEKEDQGDGELSDYMKARAENIARHNARLRTLGLISALEEKRSNAAALGQHVPKKENDAEITTKKRKNQTTEHTTPSRKSLRLQGMDAEITSVKVVEEHGNTEQERVERVKECREVRLRAAKAIAEAGAEKAAKENPTATYEHCLMRVQTMTHKGLINRVKAIERAAGRHCVVKMAIFKSCLQDENMWDLAQVASDALERLKGLQPPPE